MQHFLSQVFFIATDSITALEAAADGSSDSGVSVTCKAAKPAESGEIDHVAACGTDWGCRAEQRLQSSVGEAELPLHEEKVTREWADYYLLVIKHLEMTSHAEDHINCILLI